MSNQGKTSSVLLLLALLLAMTVSNTASSANVSVVAQVPITTSRSVPVYEEVLPSSSSTLGSVSSIKDYGGNAYDSWMRLIGNDTRVIIQKRNPAGALVAQHEVLASNGRKMRDASIFLDGDDIAVRDAAYGLTSPNRVNGIEAGRWENIAVPFPNGVNPASGAGASTYIQSQQAESGPTKEEIAQEVIKQLKAEMGGEIRAVLEQKAQDAIGKSFDPARYFSDPRARYVQDAALPWFRDRAFQGATSALGEYRACRAP